MKKIVEINVTHLYSTGRIMFQIAEAARKEGMSVTTFSKKTRTAKKEKIDNHYLVGSVIENTLHRYFSWYTDFQDCGTYFGTRKLIRQLKKIQPDIIHLHDVVGWYINISLLFKYLKKANIPVVWTFHDCWAYTGRCIYYDYVKCEKWMNGCNGCIQLDGYPSTKLFDHASWNYKRKKKLFTSLDNMTIVTPSEWLKKETKKSFLKKYPCIVINNGIDTSIFKPRKSNFREQYGLEEKKIVLGVASNWGQIRKGYKYMLYLADNLDEDYKVVIVGLDENEVDCIPDNIVSINKTSDDKKLAEIYSAADVFVNPTLEDNYPTTNMEAIACGTPIVTFETGGSVETVTEYSGMVVPQKDVEKLKNAVEYVAENEEKYFQRCVEMGKTFDKKLRFKEYIDLFRKIGR